MNSSLMSDEDRDVDIESDEEEFGIHSPSGSGLGKNGSQFQSQADKRAHHNALERKRRDHIKDSFTSLRDSVPALQGEKVSEKAQASRAQILKKAAEYIQLMRRKNTSHQQDIDDLKRQNKTLEEQIRSLEKAKTSGFAVSNVMENTNHVNGKRESAPNYDNCSGSESSEMDDGSSDEEEEEEDEEEERPEETDPTSRRKKLKTGMEEVALRL